MTSDHTVRKKPNFLFIIVDQERYPCIYDPPEIRQWSRTNLVTQERLRTHGMEFHRHYVAATACCPSRASLFTGQYPSLHGVSQTTGAAKEAFEPDMFWLDPNTVPTMGDYFRQAGYRTYYKGKWHFSEADILVPGTHNALPSFSLQDGMPDPKKAALYLLADRLDNFGFSSWVGPEPHGRDPRNSGSSAAVGLSGRDVVYAAEVVELIQALDANRNASPSVDQAPWLIVASFVNPHDIAIYGLFSRLDPFFHFAVDETVPDVPPPPTSRESLRTKPRCQQSYRDVYPLAFQPIFDNPFYRRLYYQLQKNADEQMAKVFAALCDSSFYEETIVIFTSDHGELLGAHGGLHQKWYCAYEEAIHVPLIIHNPRLFPHAESVDMLTSHVDLLPTMLGLAGADTEGIRLQLMRDHADARPLVGRNLAPLVLGEDVPQGAGEPITLGAGDPITLGVGGPITLGVGGPITLGAGGPIYFMTDDDVTKGLYQQSVLGRCYDSVIQPNSVETVIAEFHSGGHAEIWKYSRYFDNPTFSPTPSEVAADEFELYNLTADPLEQYNLANPAYSTPQSRVMEREMANLLRQQSAEKRLVPLNKGIPSWRRFTPMADCDQQASNPRNVYRQ